MDTAQFHTTFPKLAKLTISLAISTGPPVIPNSTYRRSSVSYPYLSATDIISSTSFGHPNLITIGIKSLSLLDILLSISHMSKYHLLFFVPVSRTPIAISPRRNSISSRRPRITPLLCSGEISNTAICDLAPRRPIFLGDAASNFDPPRRSFPSNHILYFHRLAPNIAFYRLHSPLTSSSPNNFHPCFRNPLYSPIPPQSLYMLDSPNQGHPGGLPYQKPTCDIRKCSSLRLLGVSARFLPESLQLPLLPKARFPNPCLSYLHPMEICSSHAPL